MNTTPEQLELAADILRNKKPFQYRRLSETWSDCEEPHVVVDLLYSGYDIQLKAATFPPKPEGMEWHNPDNVPPELVGEGWRLLVKEEIEEKAANEREIKCSAWLSGLKKWDHIVDYNGKSHSLSFRLPLSTPYPDGSRIVDGKLVKPWVPKFKVGDRVKHRNDVGTIEPYAIDTTGTHYYMVKFDNGFVDEKHEDDLEPAPEPKRVPLGPEDACWDAVFRWKNDPDHEVRMNAKSPAGIWLGSATVALDWKELMDECEIHRPSNLDPSGKPVWEECSKPA